MSVTLANSYSSGVYTGGNIILSTSYTVPAGTDELLIFVYVDGSNTAVVNPDIVDFNGVAATLVSPIPVDAGGTGQLHYFYRIPNPTAGTFNLRSRHPTTHFGMGAVCVSVSGNYILTYSSFNYAISTSPSVTISSATGDTTIFSLTANNIATTAVTETGGQTVLSEGGTDTNAMHQISSEISAGASNGATWTITPSNRQSAIAVNIHEIAQSIDTLTSPLVPNAAFSGTCTGYTNGAAVLSFSGVSINVTIASGAFSGTVPMLADGVLWPRLPATSQTISLTQGADVSTITRNISLPTGYETIRDVSDVVSNFVGIIADDDTYLQYWFVAEGNPLTTSDTAYFTTSGNYEVYRDSGVGADTGSLPRTDTVFIQRSGGVVYEHEVTLNAAGSIVVVTGINGIRLGIGIGIGI